MIEAAKVGDIFCTVTGCKDVIVKEHYKVMKIKLSYVMLVTLTAK